MALRYSSIDEKSFIRDFVLPYPFYITYSPKGGYGHTEYKQRYYPIFNFDPLLGRGCASAIPNSSIIIPLSGQKHYEAGHYLYIGFGRMRRDKYIFYPCGPIAFNVPNKQDIISILNDGRDNTIPAPLSIDHLTHTYTEGETYVISNGKPSSSGLLLGPLWAHKYAKGELISKARPSGPCWILQLYDKGFLSTDIICKGKKEVLCLSRYHEGEYHGLSTYEGSSIQFEHGYAKAFMYHNKNGLISFLPFHTCIRGDIIITGNFRHTYIPIREESVIRLPPPWYTRAFSSLTLHDVYGAFTVWCGENLVVNYRLNSEGKLHGVQRSYYNDRKEIPSRTLPCGRECPTMGQIESSPTPLRMGESICVNQFFWEGVEFSAADYEKHISEFVAVLMLPGLHIGVITIILDFMLMH